MATKKVAVAKDKSLKKKAELNKGLLVSLVKGLEDIKAGRIKPWRAIN